MIYREDSSLLIRKEIGLEEAIALIVKDIIHVDIVFERLLGRGYGNFAFERRVATISTRVFVCNKVIQFHLEG